MEKVLSKIRIGVVDDHNLFRKGIGKLIRMVNENKYEVSFEADNGFDLQSKLKHIAPPDIITMDIDMPGMDGFESVRWLRQYHRSIKVLVLTMHETEKTIVQMLRLGVNGYLSKDIEIEDLKQALDKISETGFYYSEDVLKALTKIGISEHIYDDLNNNPKLTPREIEFIKLACTDLGYKEIAAIMQVSPKTVEGYRESLFEKCQTRNRVGLAMYAVKNGIISL